MNPLRTYLALDDDDASEVVDGDAARVLQDGRAKLAHKAPVSVVDIHLYSTQGIRLSCRHSPILNTTYLSRL